MNVQSIKLNDQISWNQVKGEIFVIDTISGEYHTFNETGNLIWKAITKQATFNDIIKKLTSKYNIDNHKAAEELKRFIDKLIRIGLLKKEN
jgi:hypothetical protein